MTKPSAKSLRRPPPAPAAPPALPTREREMQAARIRHLESDCDEWEEQYQSKCREVRNLYVTLEDIAELLKRNPPAVAQALEAIAEELE